MERGPGSSTGSAFFRANEITNDVPLYKPSSKGLTQFRVIPMFDEQGNELPWVDYAKAEDEPREGLGAQHYETSVVTAFLDKKMHFFSVVSTPVPGGEPVQSPAAYVQAKVEELTTQAAGYAQSGFDIAPILTPDKWGRSFMRQTDMHLVQALLYHLDGKQVKDKAGNAFRVVVLQIPFSAVSDLTGKLFTKATISADGSQRAANVEESQFVDYASSVGGHILNIVPKEQEKNRFAMLKGELQAVDVAFMKSVSRPWTRGTNPIYTVPTHQQVIEDLLKSIPHPVIGRALIDTPYEQLLSSDVVEQGSRFNVTLERSAQSGPSAGGPKAPSAPAAPPTPPGAGQAFQPPFPAPVPASMLTTPAAPTPPSPPNNTHAPSAAPQVFYDPSAQAGTPPKSPAAPQPRPTSTVPTPPSL